MSTKKIISVLLSIVLLLSVSVQAFAVETKEDGSQYPYILVHGMMGWGDDEATGKTTSYWGFGDELENGVNRVVKYFHSQGYECYAPSVSPLGSAWDRACELYAKLTGTRVDYGEAHSQKAGHERYGRDYTGKALMGEPWDYNSEKINLISHSFGGPTIRALASLMAYGDSAELEASGENCSELFKGGHTECIFSVSTLVSPHNGSPVANLMNDTFLPIFVYALAINREGTKENPETDYMFDQWGLTGDPSKGETVSFSLAKCLNVARSNDNCAYDMTLRGATELNEKIKTVPSIYYFSYSCDLTSTNKLGIRTMKFGSAMDLTGIICLMSVYKLVDFQLLGSEWGRNDGIVPLPSALYPNSDENNHVDYTVGMEVQKGVWYVMPTIIGYGHGYHVSGTDEELAERYNYVIDRIKSCG